MSCRKHLDKVKDFFIRAMSCFEQPERPLQIGYPTDFRSEEVKMPGLTEAQQALIRDMASADARRMLASSPQLSSNVNCYPIPAPPADTMTLPHHSPPLSHHQSAIDRVRRHARKLSAKIGYHGVSPEEYTSRPIESLPGDGDDSDEHTLGLGIGGVGVAKDSLFTTDSRDSVTLGGSDRSLGVPEKEMMARG